MAGVTPPSAWPPGMEPDEALLGGARGVAAAAGERPGNGGGSGGSHDAAPGHRRTPGQRGHWAVTAAAAAAVAAVAVVATAVGGRSGGLVAAETPARVTDADGWTVVRGGLAVPMDPLWEIVSFPAVLDLTMGRMFHSYTVEEPGRRVTGTFENGRTVTMTVASRDDNGKRLEYKVTGHSPDAWGPDRPDLTGTAFAITLSPYIGNPSRASMVKVGMKLPPAAAANPRLVGWFSAAIAAMVDNARLTKGAYPCDDEFRSYSGTCNNEAQPRWGAASSALMRMDPALDGLWADGGSVPLMANRPNCRDVSNAVTAVAPGTVAPRSGRGLTDMWTFWGQFLDHDLAITFGSKGTVGEELMNIPVTDPADVLPVDTIAFSRSLHMRDARPCCGSGYAEALPRQHPNMQTAFVDGSQLYGAERDRVDALREHVGGRLRVGTVVGGGPLMPDNSDDALGGTVLPNDPSEGPEFFAAGDRRANEQPVLAALHTVFVREHNRVAALLADQFGCWTDEQLYQYARKIVAATLQAITYQHWLPLLVGPTGNGGLPPYKGYDATVNPTISNFFTTAAFRFGHSAVPDTLHLRNADGSSHARDGVELKKIYFDPAFVREVGIEPLLTGAAHNVGQEVDRFVADALRNALFANLDSNGLDLVSLNCQRGRDHGLPTLNTARRMYGLPPHKSLSDLAPGDAATTAALSSVYTDPDHVDPFVGGLAEAHVPGAAVGSLFHASFVDQFSRLRDGDRFYYESVYWPARVRALPLVQAILGGTRTLKDVLVDNTNVPAAQWPDDVFQLP
ncbi:hypothetical protein MMPV_004787 [Pyropia vietnamensis]